MSIIDRIYEFVDFQHITINEFSKNVEVSNGYFAKQRNSNGNIGSHIIEKIVRKYPSLSLNWLITGIGEMNTTAISNTNFSIRDNDFRDKKTTIVSDSDTTYNINANKPMRKQVPFYNLPVSAGPLGVLNMDYYTSNLPDGYSELPLFDGCETILPVIGLSMDPIVRPGDYIGITRINLPNRDLSFIITGQIYLIVTRYDRMIKYIEDCEDENYIVAKSHNHKPFKILKEDILEVYLVKAVAKNLM